jgi:hypothetical protein
MLLNLFAIVTHPAAEVLFEKIFLTGNIFGDILTGRSETLLPMAEMLHKIQLYAKIIR